MRGSTLGSMDILTILILQLHEYEISFHMCHFLFLLSMSYSFQCTDLLPLCLNLFLSIFLNAIVNTVVFFASSDCSLLVGQN